MIIRKITAGFVIQTFDTKKKQFTSQEFVAGTQCDYEDETGNNVDYKLLEVKGKEVYLPYNMVQPKIL